MSKLNRLVYLDPFGESKIPINVSDIDIYLMYIGYDRNDLVSTIGAHLSHIGTQSVSQNLDRFTDIIRRSVYSLLDSPANGIIAGDDLRSITAIPYPSPSIWAFSPENNLIFAADRQHGERVAPDDWVAKRGLPRIQAALAR
jgi:hypothetical protein